MNVKPNATAVESAPCLSLYIILSGACAVIIKLISEDIRHDLSASEAAYPDS